MKILNKLSQNTSVARPRKVIEGKNKGNYQKQCGLSNSSLHTMLNMMSTFTSMMGFACFISNLINSIKQDTIKQAYPGSVRYQLNALIGFALFIIIVGLVQIFLQVKRYSRAYFISYITLIPIALTMISLSSVFYSRIYHPIEANFTQSECENRVKRVLGQSEEIFQYYENVYNYFCGESCPCTISNEYILKINKHIYQGGYETYSQCPVNTSLQKNESYDYLLEELEEHYNCAGLCSIHEYFSYRNVGNSLPQRTCIIALTEEYNLIAVSTIAINTISSLIMILFSLIFLLICKKIFYIWQYKLLKEQQKQKLTQNTDVLNLSTNKPLSQQQITQPQAQNMHQSTISNSSHSTNSSANKCPLDYQIEFITQSSVVHFNQDITRQDVCDQKEKCEKLERIVQNLRLKVQEKEGNQQQNEIELSGDRYELEEANKMHLNAERQYQHIVRQFQQQQKQPTNTTQTNNKLLYSPKMIELPVLKESSSLNQQQQCILNDHIVIDIPAAADPNQVNQSNNIINNNKQPSQSPKNQNSQLSGEKLKPTQKIQLQIIEEEMKQFDSVS